MHLYLSGAESSAHLELMRECGVHRVAVSLNNLARHTSNFGQWASGERLSGLDWVVYADVTSAPVAPVLELLSGAETEPEAVIGPVSWVDGTWLETSDLLFLPLWDGHDQGVLRDFIELYDGVVLPDTVVDNPQAVRTAKAGIGAMQQVGGITGRSKGVDRFNLLVSTAWWEVPKHGETQVWTGSRLVRLNSTDKHAKRERHSESIEALGCDVGAVLSDDPKETSKLAIKSWMAMEKHLAMGRTVAQDPSVVTSGQSGQGGTAVPAVANGVAPARQQTSAQVANRMPGNKQLLPSITSDWDAGDGTMRSTSDTVLKCNTCIIAGACPGYQQGADCHYAIPVVIRTKEQRRAVMQTMQELQTQRVLMEVHVEQVNGERGDQAGKEMDRLFKMFKDARDVDEVNKVSMTMTATGEQNGSGALSRLFGEEAGRNAQVLDVPLAGEEVVQEHLG